MTDFTNQLNPFTIYTASTFHTTQATAGSQLVGDYHVPADAVRQSTGPEARRMFNTDRFAAPWYGSILFSHFLDCPVAGSVTVPTALWDVGSQPGGTNQAGGGYGTQINKVGAERRYEFLWRNAGSAAAPVTLLSVDLDDLTTPYPPLLGNGKYGNIFHLGAVLHFLPEGRYVDLWVDGNVAESETLPDGEDVIINDGAGLMLWGAARDFNDAAALVNVMNATDSGFRFSSFLAQRIETDRSDTAAAIMAEAMETRLTRPPTSEGL